MSIRRASISDLIRAVQQAPDAPVLVIGAAVSGLEPTHAPGAAMAVEALLGSMLRSLADPSRDLPWQVTEAQIESFSRALALSAHDRDRLVTPLEATLEAVDRHLPGVGVDTALGLALGSGHPNPLHRWLASVASREQAIILTTNWDEHIETCDPGLAAARWICGDTISTGFTLAKLHGTVSNPTSLRHTLATVDQRFPDDVVVALRAMTSRPVVALGYGGADYDVMHLLAPRGGPIYWLVRPDGSDSTHAPTLVEALGRERDLHIVAGDLGEVAYRLTGANARYKPLIPGTFSAALRHAFDQTSDGDLVDLIKPIVAEARVTSPSAGVVASDFAGYLGRSWRGTRLWLEWQAYHHHHRGGPLHRFRAALLFRRLAQGAPGAYEQAVLMSHGADALDGWLYGQGPLVRARTLRTHMRAAEHSTNRRGWFWFRAARSAWARHRDETVTFLARAYSLELDTWERGHCLRFEARLLARREDPGFRALLDEAEELFAFGSRSQAVLDLQRTRALCEFALGNRAAAQRLLSGARREHRQRGQRSGWVQAACAGLVIRYVPVRIARRVLRP